MAFTNSNDYLDGRKPVVIPDNANVVGIRYSIELETGDLDQNDIGAVGILPAGCLPLAVWVDADDLDTHESPTIAASIGLLNSGGTDLDVTWGTGMTVGQAGTAAAVVSAALSQTTASTSDRKIGVKFTAAAATKAAGTLGVTIMYRQV